LSCDNRRKVPQDLRLAQFGKAGKILAAKFGAQEFGATPIAGSARRQVGSAPAFQMKVRK